MDTSINNNSASGVKWFFNGYPNMELLDIYEQYFTLTANLVKKITNKSTHQMQSASHS